MEADVIHTHSHTHTHTHIYTDIYMHTYIHMQTYAQIERRWENMEADVMDAQWDLEQFAVDYALPSDNIFRFFFCR